MKSGMIHKLAPMALMAMLAVGLSACGGEEETDTTSDTDANEEQVMEQNGDMQNGESSGQPTGDSGESAEEVEAGTNEAQY